MSAQSSNSDSLKSRLLFFIVGIATVIILSELDIVGAWVIPAGILVFVIFTEAYRFLTSKRSSGQ